VKTLLGRFSALLVLLAPAALLHACVGSAPDELPPGPIGSSQSSIEGGDFINDPANPISSLFPISTVHVSTPGTKPDGGIGEIRCTGTLVSPTQILTAAHCPVSQQTSIDFYSTTPGGGANPILPVSALGAKFSYPPGVCAPAQFGVPFAGPTTCTDYNFYTCPAGTGCDETNGTFSDLAVITLSAPITGPYKPVQLGPVALFAGSYDLFPTYEVGTGLMNVFASGGRYTYDDAGNTTGELWDASNAAVRNASDSMQWVPMVLTPRDGGTNNDNDGSFKALLHYSDHGDSGGPVFQYVSPTPVDAASFPLMGNNNFVLLGVCHGRTPDGTQSVFTSVENTVNNAWLHRVLVGQPPSVSITTFGASL
jgi:hypothetical protein